MLAPFDTEVATTKVPPFPVVPAEAPHQPYTTRQELGRLPVACNLQLEVERIVHGEWGPSELRCRGRMLGVLHGPRSASSPTLRLAESLRPENLAWFQQLLLEKAWGDPDMLLGELRGLGAHLSRTGNGQARVGRHPEGALQRGTGHGPR